MQSELSPVRTKFLKQQAELLLKSISNQDFPPVSLEEIVLGLKKTHGLEVYWRDLGEGVHGILVFLEDGTPSIGVNSTQAEVRQRYTLAHEIGHLMLDHICDGDDVPEKEAQRFAAELLMPTKSIRGDVEGGMSVLEMMKRYEVSEQAMWIRIDSCNLLEKVTPAT